MQQAVGREGAASPGPTHFSPQQMKSYLQDLRTNRPARPTGARPAPAHFNTWSSRSGPRLSESSNISPLQRTFTDPVADVDARPSTSHDEPKMHSRRTSKMSIDEIIQGPGRALVQPPRGRDTTDSSTRSRTPSVQYRESEQRQTEQEEARAVRIAMEELELAQEEKLFDAARDEAAELVYKHRNPDAPGKGPTTPYAYPGLASKGSTQRSRSVEPKDQDLQRANSKLRKRHSMGSATSGSRSSSLQSNGGGSSSESSGLNTSPTKEDFDSKDKATESSSLRKAISDLPSFGSRRKSSGSRRKISGSLFSNPNDQIYEEPEEDSPAKPKAVPAATEPPKSEKLPLGIRRNPFMRFQSVKGNPMIRSNTDPVLGNKNFDRYEIQKNPPTQSRNAAYTLNPSVVTKPAEPVKADAENEPEIKMKDGKEIRSDDLRAATGFRLRDRSPHLPTPTMVSDSPGRPIVSFKKGYNEIELKEDVYGSTEALTRPSGPSPRPLSNAVTSPAVPTINTMDDTTKNTAAPPPVPQISVSSTPPAVLSRFNKTEKKPTINIHEDAPARPLSSAASRKFNAPPPATAPSRPTINPYQLPSAHSQPVSAPSVPTISVSETPSMMPTRPANTRGHSVNVPSIGVSPPVPSISVSESPAPNRGRGMNAPSIGVTPPVPSISVSESPAPNRGRGMPTPSIGVSPPVPSISVSESPASNRGRGGSVPSISVTPEIPSISVNAAPVPARGPTINAPSISVTPTVPSINVNGSTGSTRPLPDPKHHSSRPFGRGGATTNTRGHWTPTNVRTGALCTQCALPIAGRIVSAAGSRFHPECFACYQCGEHLECVAFYPEPENKLAERIARIHARQRGEDIPYLPTHPTPDDMARLEHQDGTDESQRFFCHLDFHEMFSPRCKSCKTPIEGEVIVACGAEWHAGHFFCAQCGDPFDSSTPFVEKDGYAWCVNCHTHRYSTKCKKCRKPVTDTVVKALGAEWHVGCFCCVECSGPFQDGRYFLRGESQDPVCVKCEERRLKA
ncbi:hypothetical protein HBH56_033620 [Parastagonospora nodorum]|uniref:LIM zinc-binding domain-containing protein n=1 Tax=Phaeosphaeria nodorum (strain SN15 / ATCC MYA-4574 / FGSC 10173) TaxID=321614 RepID=A0A7U2F8B1_PHANO|nr:hypothetical protein HBH56_033620 [Parastagonospora nodorum]QRD00223.1 hypothetical protein JI435_071100 [Parastagonospora nodorum SN15]KAH3933449.1 hypothetical protein HBH54_065810 [Parastagonospora nodorum]KAH3952577.1 hypothetical protein HBH53_044220 [Parastagonospora nodorum]KAH3980417.1 hypothetical protein HBH52_091400 [Parastagonospora nodorum]